jgi:hypothetical protein
MYVPFEELPPQARVWIYQSGRVFSDAEAAEIQNKIEAFAAQWSAHGQALHASGVLLHKQFVVLGTDANVTVPSGCSIDSSVQFIRSLEMDYNTSLFDRTQLAFQKNGAIKMVHLTEMPAAVAAGEITPETPFFDNLAPDAGSLKANWVKPAGRTWLQKYF